MKKITTILAAILLSVAGLTSAANAATVSVSVSGAASGSGTSASPAVISVPSDDTISGQVLTVAVTVDDTSTVTNITTTGGVRVIRSYDATTKSDAGVSSLSITPTSTTFTVYAYTTSTTTGTIVFSVTGQTTTYYVQGSAGDAYKVSLSVPSAGNTSGTVTAIAVVTDLFGNPKATAPTFTVVNGTAASATTTVIGEYKSVITLPSVAGTTAIEASITAPTAIAGFTAVSKASAFVVSSDLAAANVALTAEVAALKVKLSSAESALAAEKAARAADAVTTAATKKTLEDSLAVSAKRIAYLEARVKALKAKK